MGDKIELAKDHCISDSDWIYIKKELDSIGQVRLYLPGIIGFLFGVWLALIYFYWDPRNTPSNLFVFLLLAFLCTYAKIYLLNKDFIKHRDNIKAKIDNANPKIVERNDSDTKK